MEGRVVASHGNPIAPASAHVGHELPLAGVSRFPLEQTSLSRTATAALAHFCSSQCLLEFLRITRGGDTTTRGFKCNLPKKVC